METVSKTDLDQFERVYHENGVMFARHADLIKILGWDRSRYESVIMELQKTGQWILEGGNPSGDKQDFPVKKTVGSSSSLCYSIRKC